MLKPAVRESYLRLGPKADRDKRGGEPFVEVSWDTALDIVAAELDRVRTASGNEAIFGGSCGWASAGRFHHAQSHVHRFLNCIGGYTRSVGNYSYGAADVLLPHVIGDTRSLAVGQTSWKSLRQGKSLVLMFGGMPAKNGQVGSGGIVQHSPARRARRLSRGGLSLRLGLAGARRRARRKRRALDPDPPQHRRRR